MPDHAQPTSGFILGNKTYDKFRHAIQYWIPALGTFYAGLATIWGLPYGVEVVGTLTALGTLLGVIMGISRSTYDKTDAAFDGALVVDETANKSLLDLQTPIEQMAQQKQIVFKVKHEPGALVQPEPIDSESQE